MDLNTFSNKSRSYIGGVFSLQPYYEYCFYTMYASVGSVYSSGNSREIEKALYDPPYQVHPLTNLES